MDGKCDTGHVKSTAALTIVGTKMYVILTCILLLARRRDACLPGTIYTLPRRRRLCGRHRTRPRDRVAVPIGRGGTDDDEQRAGIEVNGELALYETMRRTEPHLQLASLPPPCPPLPSPNESASSAPARLACLPPMLSAGTPTSSKSQYSTNRQFPVGWPPLLTLTPKSTVLRISTTASRAAVPFSRTHSACSG